MVMYDKAWQKNPAALQEGLTTPLDGKAQAIRDRIDSAPDTLKTEGWGTAYYISPKGNDENDGKSPETAWQTTEAITNHRFKPGDIVLFERGGVYRNGVQVVLSNGVSYGAYGEGERPCLYQSTQNYAEAQWIQTGDRLWELQAHMLHDVGVVVFDHGVQLGARKYTAEEVQQDYDFHHNYETGKLTLMLDRDPSTLYKSIEIGWNGRIFVADNRNNITIENLTFKYAGGHAIRASGVFDFTVRGCEFGFIGGSDMQPSVYGPVRYGNGIDMIGCSRNTVIENCWFYQIYDSAVTYQGDVSKVYDFTVRDCLMECIGMGGFEYWGSTVTDVLLLNNFMRFSGYGFGRQRPDHYMSGHIMSNGKPNNCGYNKATRFHIIGNTFELSENQLINAVSSAGTPPVLDGNTYVQKKGGLLGYYKTNENVTFDDTVEHTLNTLWGDKNATVIYR